MKVYRNSYRSKRRKLLSYEWTPTKNSAHAAARQTDSELSAIDVGSSTIAEPINIALTKEGVLRALRRYAAHP